MCMVSQYAYVYFHSNNVHLNSRLALISQKPRTHWPVAVSFCQLSDWQLLISCIFGSNWTYYAWKFLLLLLLPILLPKIREIRSFQSLNWQKLAVTDQCVLGLTSLFVCATSLLWLCLTYMLLCLVLLYCWRHITWNLLLTLRYWYRCNTLIRFALLLALQYICRCHFLLLLSKNIKT